MFVTHKLLEITSYLPIITCTMYLFTNYLANAIAIISARAILPARETAVNTINSHTRTILYWHDFGQKLNYYIVGLACTCAVCVCLCRSHPKTPTPKIETFATAATLFCLSKRRALLVGIVHLRQRWCARRDKMCLGWGIIVWFTMNLRETWVFVRLMCAVTCAAAQLPAAAITSLVIHSFLNRHFVGGVICDFWFNVACDVVLCVLVKTAFFLLVWWGR